MRKMIEQEVTILLVEDDEGHAELVKINLERSGVVNEIKHFSHGQKVIDFLLGKDAQHDGKYLMILDINMPGLDGHQVLEKIKSNELTKHIPVIMLTTTENDVEIERCYKEGCNFYLVKPMEYEEFTNAVNELGLFLQTVRIPDTKKVIIRNG